MILDLDDIAALWKVPRDYARDTLTKLPEFPEPAPGSSKKFPRWRERDVHAFLGLAEEAEDE